MRTRTPTGYVQQLKKEKAVNIDRRQVDHKKHGELTWDMGSEKSSCDLADFQEFAYCKAPIRVDNGRYITYYAKEILT